MTNHWVFLVIIVNSPMTKNKVPSTKYQVQTTMTILLLLFLFIYSVGNSQGLPDTEIFLANLTIEEGDVTIGKPMNITNREGYDNQPSFSPDGRSIYFTSIRDTIQADTYRHDIEEDSTVRVTSTEESEYSPTVMFDERFFSVVRVEKDSTQRLWKFNLDGTNPELVLKGIKPVGYHCWLDSFWVALFVLGEPNLLLLTDIRNEKPVTIANNIGRSLHVVPGENAMSYVAKENDSTWLIRTFNFDLKRTATIAQTLQGSEDFVWLPNRTLLMAKGSTIYKFNPESDATWVEIADVSGDGITSITRLAVNREATRLAIVGIKEKKE
ncbi:MAG: hypothetical protein EPO24_02620 [Bacteroidetes bacterium]|nr:MAG: hypothetical protein EPO24_02620 [Bacteroidota bacterium]